MQRHEQRTEEERVAVKPAPAATRAPAPLEWASAVGNQAVARMARERSVARQEEEAAPEPSTADESPDAVEEGFPDEELVSDAPAGPVDEEPVAGDDALPA